MAELAGNGSFRDCLAQMEATDRRGYHGQRLGLGRRLETTQKRLDSGVSRLSEASSSRELLMRLAATALIALLTAGVLHVLIWTASRAGGVVLPMALLMPVTILCLAAIGLLLALYWRSRLDETDARTAFLGLFGGLIVAAVALEFSSGVQLLLWQGDRSRGAHGAGDPELWKVELQYGWHLLDAVPLLSIPRSLRLAQPDLFRDTVSGALLLTFQLAVIIPMIHLTLSGYRSAERGLAAIRESERYRQLKKTPQLHMGERWDSGVWSITAVIGGVGLLAAGIVWQLSDGGSVPNQLLRDQVPRDATVAGVTVPLGWVQAIPEVASALILGLFAVGALVAPLEYEAMPYIRRRNLAGAVVGLILAATVVAAFIVAATVALIGVGLASADHTVAPDASVGTAISFHAWHLLDGIPGLEVPDTLNWQLRNDLQDSWTGALLLALKIVLLAAVVFTSSRIIGPYVRRRRQAQGTPGMLEQAAAFERSATEVDRLIRRIEDDIERGSHTLAHGWDVQRRIDRMEQERRAVEAIFGSGPVTESAHDLIESLTERRRRLHEHLGFGAFAASRRQAVPVPTLRAQTDARHTEYRRIVAEHIATVLGQPMAS
jgi:hypothetical protein